MIRIVPHTKPLNHRLWKLIYLLAILLPLIFAPTAKGNDTTKVKQIERVEYHDYLLEQYIRTQELYERFYGKRRVEVRQRTPQEKKKESRPSVVEIPEPQPSPHLAQVQTRRKRAREHSTTQDQQTSRVALLIWRKDHRGSYRTFAKSPPGQRTVNRSPRQLSP